MLGTILLAYCGSDFILGYLELMDSLFSWVDKITEPDMEKAQRDMDKISNILKQAEKQIKTVEKLEKRYVQ